MVLGSRESCRLLTSGRSLMPVSCDAGRSSGAGGGQHRTRAGELTGARATLRNLCGDRTVIQQHVGGRLMGEEDRGWHHVDMV